MDNLMIDIETLDTRPTAVILSIGAVFFDKTGISKSKPQFYEIIDINSCLECGRTVSGETISWWMQQDEKAKEVFRHGFGKELWEVLEVFYDFIYMSTHNKESLEVWSNGSDMDLVILKDAFQGCKIDVPWNYKNVNCFRHHKKHSPQIAQLPPDGEVSHHALCDAIWQAQYVVEVMNGRFAK